MPLPAWRRRGGHGRDAAAAAGRMAAAVRSRARAEPESGSDGWVPEDGSAASTWLPSTLHGARVDLGRSGFLALAVVVLVAAFGAGLLAWRSRPVALPAPAPTPVPSRVLASAPAIAGPRVVVHVIGKVQRPGVVALPPGSRVTDALRAAGGLRPGTDPGLLNLARRVVDGEQIVAGAPAGPPSVPSVGSGAAASAVVDLNTASVVDLDALPGVGPVLAQRIVDWRTRHGPFREIAQLREVDGIGEQRYQDLRDRVRV